MSFLPPMTGFAPPQQQLGQPVPAAASAARPGAATPGMGQMPLNTAASPAAVDPSQFGIAGQGLAVGQPTPGVFGGQAPEVNRPQPLPAIRGVGNMHMGAVNRLRGVQPTHGRPY